jgi:small subunit ribosomal protein S17
MKIFEGIVISTKMNNTVIVEVSRRTPHPLYKKLIKRSKKYKADTTDVNAEVGNRVRIVETKPFSKDKYFKVLEVMNNKETKEKKGKKKNGTA